MDTNGKGKEIKEERKGNKEKGAEEIKRKTENIKERRRDKGGK